MPPKVDRKNPWTLKSTREVYDNPWIHVDEDRVIDAGGKDGIYGRVHFKSLAVGIVPLAENGDTFLVGQYRYPVAAYSWEIPEGGCVLGTDPLDTAKRELKEETGMEANVWIKGLDQLWISNSVSDEAGVYYVAKDLKMGQAEPESCEALSLWRLPFTEAVAMVERGEIVDALSVLSLLHTEKRLLKGELSFE